MALSGAWVTSSCSNSDGDNCVQARRSGQASVQVRDSKDPDGPVLTFTSTEWHTFITAIKNCRDHYRSNPNSGS